VFGGIAWSADKCRITFVGETPEVGSFKNPFDTPMEEAKDSKD